MKSWVLLLIVMDLKSPKEILEMLKGFNKIVLFGDSGCAQLCDIGGILQLEDMDAFLSAHNKEVLGTIFVEGGICVGHALQQEVENNKDILEAADAFLVQACGVAVQIITDFVPEKEAFPAADSKFSGAMPERFIHHEKCTLCGDCILDLTAGICPIARCPKGMLNGPCGGSMDGMCERDEETECAWHLIYERLKRLGKLDNIRSIWNLKDWSIAQGPRSIIRNES